MTTTRPKPLTRIALMCALALGAILAPATQASAAAPESVTVTYWELRPQHSDLCADVAGSSQADGALIRQRYCYQARNQHWRIVPSSIPGYVELKAWHSNKCLGVRSGSYSNGALIHQWTCNGAASQQWYREPIGSGWYRLRAYHSDKCLDVQYGSYSDGATIQQWECGSNPQQRWRFV